MPELTTGQALNKALSLILEQNPTAFIAGEDIGIYGGAFGVTDGLLAQFGEDRIKDTPISEDAIAVKVDGYHSSNKIPHVTIAIPKDGKPFHSNLITDWRPVDEEIILKGKVREIYS